MSMHAGEVRLGPSEVVSSKRADGCYLVRSPHALGPYPRAMTDLLDRWAAATPECTLFAQRAADGGWRTVTYAGARAQARDIAQALLDRGLGPERPVAILSGNSIEHALIGLASMYAGIPFASVSPAYSLISNDLEKLRYILRLLTPGLVFASSGRQFARAIALALPRDIECVVGEAPPDDRPATPLSALSTPATAAVDEAHARVGPDTIAKILFTSGSTSSPKGVINTQRMLTANQVMIQQAFPCLMDAPPILVDWLPWSHTFGANHNLGLVLMNGGTLYIDEGKPLPGAIEATVKNLRDIAPTVYFNVPKGYEMLLPYLRAEPQLRTNFFSRLQFVFYAGAALAPHVWRELEDLSIEATGARVPMVTSLGSTETAPAALSVTPKSRHPGVIGIPNVGVEMKLVPNAGKLEARLKGANITPGYWRQPELTRQVFDAEGYYELGDALRFADPDDPERGFVFDGRIAEDFKLATGTWVSVGPLRGQLIGHFASYVRDVVIAGHDRDDIAALFIPDIDACRGLAAGLDKAASVGEVLGHAALREKFAALLAEFNKERTHSSVRVPRITLMEAPPSIDKGEITDKGSINQRVVLEQRADLVQELYAATPSARIIAIG